MSAAELSGADEAPPSPAEAAHAPPPASPPAAARTGWNPSGQMFDPGRKSPMLAAVLSVIPGVGQLYIGYYMRGLATGATFMMLMLAAGEARGSIAPAFGMTAMFVWIFGIIDAGRMAALYNHAAAGMDAVEMPQDFKLPGMGGSIAGGAALLIFGAIALSNTRFDVPLDWLEVWWPLVPLALGAYLFGRGVMDAMAERDSYQPPAYTLGDEEEAD